MSLTAPAANIYVTASGNPAFDANLRRSLQSFGHSVTIGVADINFDGSQNMAGIDVVYLQFNYNWETVTRMPESGQLALVNFVNRGGGLVTTEWLLWHMNYTAGLPVLNPILPVNPSKDFDRLTAVAFTQDSPDPQLNAGLPSQFNMPLEYIQGTFTLFPAPRPSASSFYKITGGTVALAGWNVGSGRVLSFATTNGQAQLDNTNFQRLLSNAMDWAEQKPIVAEGGAFNAASFARAQPVAPGSLVSIFGTGLAPSLAIADSVPLATSLAGVSVTFNNIAAPLQFVSPQQINAQLPWGVLTPGTASGPASIVVRRGRAVSQTSTVQVGPAAPGIFSVEFGVGQAIAINDDGSLAAPAGSIPGVRSEPARIGRTISILGTGLGAVAPPSRDGQSSLDALRRTLATPTVLIGGVQAQVQFSGLAPQFPGVNQINVVVPPIPPGDQVPVQIRLGDITTTARVTIAVRD